MSTKKEISIIIPCYNVEKYVQRCMQSFQAQTFGMDRVEVIFVDDDSTDATWDVLCEIEKQAPEDVIIIKQEENRRQGAARNLGLSYATAPYVAFVDSDDWLDENYLEILYDSLREYDCDFTCCNLLRDYGDGRNKAICRYMQNRLYNVESDEAKGQLLVSGGLDRGPCAKLFRRNFLVSNHICFPEGIRYEDICWGALLYPYVNRFYAIAEPLYHYFVNPESTVLKNGQDYYRDLFESNYIKYNEWNDRGFISRVPEEAEFDFLVDYYLTILKMFGKRFEMIPENDFAEMQSFIKRRFPEYRKNRYIKDYLPPEVAMLINLIDHGLSKKELAELHEVIQKMNI